ncbi:MAG: lysophospholipid acyltransferase family protein [Myxococcales bacterium]|nr:lysophospholipid acyltransferase family protein [Myxococcales bacterium]
MNQRLEPTLLDRLVHELLTLGVQITRDMPLDFALPVADRVGRELFGWLGRHREIALVNLSVAYPDWSVAKRARLGRASFGNLARHWVEFVRLPRTDPEELDARVTIEGLANLDAARAEGRGVLLLTAHLGCWELLAHVLGVRVGPLTVVARRLDNPLLDAWVRSVRERSGNRVHDRDSAGHHLVDALRRDKALIGVLADQHVGDAEGIEATLFGQTVSTSRMLPLLALLTGAPVVPVHIARQANGWSHVIRIDPALPIARSGSPDRDLPAAAQCCMDAIEAMVREAPDQWLWSHRRWKTVPAIARRYPPRGRGLFAAGAERSANLPETMGS